MKVSDVMEREVITVPQSATYQEAARILRTHKISGAPVVDEAGKLVGMLSEKDLFRVLYPRYDSFYKSPEDYLDFESREQKIKEVILHPIIDFAARDIIIITTDAPIMKAGALMLARGVHRLPVVDGENLVGLITRRHVFGKVLERHFTD
jgi:CBS domain-containing protein